MYLGNLDNGLRMRYTLTEDIADLERAIQLLEQALQQPPPDFPDRSDVVKSLGSALLTRYEIIGNPEDRERANALKE
jgi:hypothetical protein